MTRAWALLSALAIISGITIILGWFMLPIRIVLVALAGIASIAAFRGRRLELRTPRGIAALGTLLILTIANVILLALAGTGEPIRSPWTIVPGAFFALFGILVAATTVFGGTTAPAVGVIGIPCALLVASLVAILVYPIGFGFDHFIHTATERIILAHGGITPPPFFYSAHYGLVGLLATFGMPADLGDRLLVPLIAAGLLAPLLFTTLRKTTNATGAALGTSSLLIVPFLPLATSTPQALANSFALATILLLMRGEIPTAVLTTAAALFANPLTGIPLIAMTIATVYGDRQRRIIAGTTIVLGIIAIPLALVVGRLLLPQLPIDVGWPTRNGIDAAFRSTILPFHAVNADRGFGDAVAIARIALPFLWIALACVGARILKRDRAPAIIGAVVAAAAAPVVFLTVGLRTQLFEEQIQFPLRLLALAGLLMTPLVGAALAAFRDRMRMPTQRLAGAITMTALAITTLVLAYPRDDAQARSGLWSVSADDISAVHAIVSDTGDVPFVVFGNQMLGAAAIREFGFQPALRDAAGNEFLAFPAPAGGPVGRWFWTIVDVKTTRTTIDAAMRDLGVHRAYLVLHDYWRNSLVLGNTLAAIADAEMGTYDHLRMFRFDRLDE